MITVAAVQAAVKAELSYRKDTIIVFFFTAKKNNDSTKLENSGLDLTRNSLFCCN